jgi:hypothetical protein
LRPERHIPNSIATMRRRLIHAITALPMLRQFKRTIRPYKLVTQ